MPYPCCCRQTNNGDFCVVCGTTTPSQWALTWPEWAIEKLVLGVYSDLIRIPTGTHILTQTPGTAGCCWHGPAFTVCTNSQGVTYVARPYAWVTTDFTGQFYLDVNFTQYLSSAITPTRQCGTFGGNNILGAGRWSRTTLAGCRSGPYTTSIAGYTRIPSFSLCQVSIYVTQTAGTVAIEAV